MKKLLILAGLGGAVFALTKKRKREAAAEAALWKEATSGN